MSHALVRRKDELLARGLNGTRNRAVATRHRCEAQLGRHGQRRVELVQRNMRCSRTTTVALACVGLINTVSAGEKRPTDAASGSRQGTHWLVFVDDLHVNFAHTGRLRTLLQSIAGAIAVPGDEISVSAALSSGAIDRATEIAVVQSAMRKISGNGLRPEDLLRQGGAQSADERVELRRRATTALAKARTLVEAAEGSPAPNRVLLFISGGYVDDGEIRARMAELITSAVENRVRIVCFDARSLGPNLLLPRVDVDADAWSRYIAETRSALRMLAEQTGGWLRDDRQPVVETIAAIRKR